MTENHTFCVSSTLTLTWVHVRSLSARAQGDIAVPETPRIAWYMKF